MSFLNRRKYSCGPQHGFTLTELLVATIVLSVTVTGVITVTRKSHENDITYLHHRRARHIIDSLFEAPGFQHLRYDSIQDVTTSVLIEDRETGDDLKGAVTIKVTKGLTKEIGGADLAYKHVQATVVWSEPEGQESATITKCIPDLR